MHVTHSSGGNVQAKVNIDRGAGIVDIIIKIGGQIESEYGKYELQFNCIL